MIEDGGTNDNDVTSHYPLKTKKYYKLLKTMI